MFARVVIAVGVLLAAWMSAGAWALGLGGELMKWYLPTIGLAVAVLAVLAGRNIARTRRNGFRTGRATIVSLALFWATGIGFGLTVPELRDGELTSVLSHLAGPETLGMSIGICNPLGIVAIVLAGFAVGFSAHDARGPKPEEPEDVDDAPRMVPHPLSRDA